MFQRGRITAADFGAQVVYAAIVFVSSGEFSDPGAASCVFSCYGANPQITTALSLLAVDNHVIHYMRGFVKPKSDVVFIGLQARRTFCAAFAATYALKTRNIIHCLCQSFGPFIT